VAGEAGLGVSLTLTAPAFSWHPQRLDTAGPMAGDLMAAAGRRLDPEQQLAVDVLMGVAPGGRWAQLEAADIKPRQNGKTTGTLAPIALTSLFLLGAELILWTAHRFSTTAEAFRDVQAIIENTDALSRRVARVRVANGEESIELVNGNRLRFLARTGPGGRGMSADLLIMDEAFSLRADHMSALIPTLSARPNPMVVYGSSAGLADSDLLRGIRDRGRAGGDPSLAYVEWAAPGSFQEPGCARRDCGHDVGTAGCALDDEGNWQAANPAMPHRIAPGFVAAERRALPPAEFARERLGWWDVPGIGTSVDLSAWNECADLASTFEGRPVFAIDVSPGSRSGAIVAAGTRADKLPHVEVIDHHAGADWIVARCVELKVHDPIGFVLDPAAAAGALLPALSEAGIEPTQMKVRDMGQACVAFAGAVEQRSVRHLGDEILSRALAGGARRDVGDGLWSWVRAKSDCDICPLVATTEALWLLSQNLDYDLMSSIAF
jgi:hypothetical protein